MSLFHSSPAPLLSFPICPPPPSLLLALPHSASSIRRGRRETCKKQQHCVRANKAALPPSWPWSESASSGSEAHACPMPHLASPKKNLNLLLHSPLPRPSPHPSPLCFLCGNGKLFFSLWKKLAIS